MCLNQGNKLYRSFAFWMQRVGLHMLEPLLYSATCLYQLIRLCASRGPSPTHSQSVPESLFVGCTKFVVKISTNNFQSKHGCWLSTTWPWAKLLVILVNIGSGNGLLSGGTKPSHYLKQCLLVISEVMCHSSEGYFTKKWQVSWCKYVHVTRSIELNCIMNYDPLVYGSGHEGGPVLLPGFAIKW